VVANIKGLPDRPRPQGDTVGFNTHQYHGSLSLVPVPDEQVLPASSGIPASAGAVRSETMVSS